MKEYLRTNYPKTSSRLILLYFITFIIGVFAWSINYNFYLYPDNLFEPLNWYRFITYSFVSENLYNLLHNSLVIFLSGFIVEKVLKGKTLVKQVFIYQLLGGFGYVLLSNIFSNLYPIASPAMISWGYSGAAIIMGSKLWKELNKFEKIITILSIISLLKLLFNLNNIGVQALIIVITYSIIFCWQFLKNNVNE